MVWLFLLLLKCIAIFCTYFYFIIHQYNDFKKEENYKNIHFFHIYWFSYFNSSIYGFPRTLWFSCRAFRFKIFYFYSARDMFSYFFNFVHIQLFSQKTKKGINAFLFFWLRDFLTIRFTICINSKFNSKIFLYSPISFKFYIT